MSDLLEFACDGWKEELMGRFHQELKNSESHLRKPPTQTGSGLYMKEFCFYAGLSKSLSDVLRILEKTSDVNIFLNSVSTKENAIYIHRTKVYALNRSEEEYCSDKSNNWIRISRLEYWTGEHEGIKYVVDKTKKMAKNVIARPSIAIFPGDVIDASE
jgi:hypothetical protein